MIVVGVREAKDRMYQLIELARAGEEVIITRRDSKLRAWKRSLTRKKRRSARHPGEAENAGAVGCL